MWPRSPRRPRTRSRRLRRAGTRCRRISTCATAAAIVRAGMRVSCRISSRARSSAYRTARTGSRRHTTRCTAASSAGSSPSRPRSPRALRGCACSSGWARCSPPYGASRPGTSRRTSSGSTRRPGSGGPRRRGRIATASTTSRSCWSTGCACSVARRASSRPIPGTAYALRSRNRGRLCCSTMRASCTRPHPSSQRPACLAGATRWC